MIDTVRQEAVHRENRRFLIRLIRKRLQETNRLAGLLALYYQHLVELESGQ
jgi:hypothetical protein